ncbi:hypothetical protein JI666_13110 [Bacillus sp. NTK071]|uniref:hypothetical protein n=1 Tax=Bacillus sp. NTK071 TaxID=2802175 RepID=UPI001A8D1A41|nr:hypothetical protein [Bacillus sp. NTK071]MBN8209690.1 hypothetical protein [Bacillus sp. NTK071]
MMFDYTKHIPLEGIPGEYKVNSDLPDSDDRAEMSFPFDYSMMIPLDNVIREE